LAVTAASIGPTGCGRSDHVVARQSDGGVGRFGAPRLIGELLDPTDHLQDPTLSNDELELYFSSPKNGTPDIWRATRASADLPWEAAVRVAELSSTVAMDVEPELTADGLTIYFSSERTGATPTFRMWSARRASPLSAWQVPQLVVVNPLDATTTDRGPTVDATDTMMVFASAPLPGGDFDLFVASRADSAAPWINRQALSALNSAWHDWDPALFRGKLALMFGARRMGDHLTTDLWETARSSDSVPFSAPTPVGELNSPQSEGDPWLSEDGRHVVFSSERTGVSRLYEAWR